MTTTAISICSKALVKIGAKAISSFDEGSAESEVAGQLYTSVRDGLLSSHPWRFASAQTSLARLADEPSADYPRAFQLPQGFLRVLSAGTGRRGQGLDYRIHEDRLHTNAGNVMLTYIFRPEENAFPAFFEQVLIAKLAAEFCLPLTESTSRTEFLADFADEMFRQAKLIDAQQAIPSCITDFPLIGVRG